MYKPNKLYIVKSEPLGEELKKFVFPVIFRIVDESNGISYDVTYDKNGHRTVLKAEDNMVVHIDGGETIVGEKTFTKAVSSPTYPTDDFHLTNKVYVDSKIENIETDYVLKSRRINTENGLEGGGELDRDLYIGIDSVTRTNIDKGVEGYEISTKIGDPDSLIPDWSNDVITKTNF